MADLLNFKVYLTKEDNTVEIRKFSMKQIVAYQYDQLKTKIREIFPDIQDDSFAVAWKDIENDNVIISSNNELEIALDEMLHTTNLCKFYITLNKLKKVHQTFSESASGPSVQKHTDVICDACNKEICGFRYKCLQCPDFDLCKDCENKSIHPEHFMIRIPIPLQWKSYYGRRLSHLLNKCMKKASSCPVAEEATPECLHSIRKENTQTNQCSPWWLDTCTAYLSDWTNLSNGILLPEINKHKAEGTESQFEKKDQNASDASPSTSTNNPEDKRLEFLKTISENISQFLDPLGIDINVQVKTDKSNQSTQPNQPTQSSEPTQPTNVNPEQNAKDQDFKRFFYRSSTNDPFKAYRNYNVFKTKENDESSKKEDSASVASAGNASTNGIGSLNNDTLKNEEWTLLDSENIPTGTTGLEQSTSTLNNSASSLNNSAPDLQAPNGTAVPPNLYQTMNDTPIVSNTAPIYPTLPTDINSFWHPDMKIQNAVVTMMKMGFTNEGGWLTKLLVSTGGDINKAMDYMSQTQ